MNWFWTCWSSEFSRKSKSVVEFTLGGENICGSDNHQDLRRLVYDPSASWNWFSTLHKWNIRQLNWLFFLPKNSAKDLLRATVQLFSMQTSQCFRQIQPDWHHFASRGGHSSQTEVQIDFRTELHECVKIVKEKPGSSSRNTVTNSVE